MSSVPFLKSLANQSITNVETLLERYPTILTENERSLPLPEKARLVKDKINQLVNQKTSHQAQQHTQQQSQSQGQPQLQPPLPIQNAPKGKPVQMKVGAVQMGQGVPIQAGQGLPQAMSQGTPQMGHVQMGHPGNLPQNQHPPVNQFQANQQYQPNAQQPQPQNQQDQLRLAQQQSNIAAMLEKSQRLQQQAVQNHQHQHPQQALPFNQSPQSGPSPSAKPAVNMQALFDNVPRMLELKRMGQLAPEQEKLFDSLVKSDIGREHLERYKAQQAAQVVQNNLSNQMTPHPQMMTQAQVHHAAQQQVAPLQQQQQLALMQAAAAAAGGTFGQLQGMGVQGGMQGQGVQGQQGMAVMQGQNMQMGLQGMVPGLQGPTGFPQGMQAQGQATGQMGVNQMPNRQPQRSNSITVSANIVPRGNVNPGAARPPAFPQDRVAAYRTQVAKLNAMTEAQREILFATRSDLRLLYKTAMPGQFPVSQPPPRPPTFPAIPQNNVSANLHIPANKQRNPSQAQGSPRPPMSIQPAIPKMLQNGIPVQGREPKFMLSQKGSSEDVRAGILRITSDLPMDRADSLLNRVTWVPTPEHDAGLRAKLTRFSQPVKPAGRSTLSAVRGMGEVFLEQMPEGIRALAEEVVGGIEEQGDDKLPGQRKRRVQDLADGVDRGLGISPEVEELMLGLADEHNDLVSAVSCSLAKHRRSETVDRKDIQLAYEMTFGRNIPGFSSDAIRMDQARSTKRAAQSTAAHAARLNKQKLINDARASWRRDKKSAVIA